MRSYNQHCAIAIALDVVGDRWSVLIVRELLLGQERWGELRDGLPGIAKNLLADRLRTLEGAGVLVHDGDRYVLTDDGRRLEPILHALAGWGAPRLAAAGVGGETRTRWVRIAAAAHPLAELQSLTDDEAVVLLDGRELRGAPADVLHQIAATVPGG